MCSMMANLSMDINCTIVEVFPPENTLVAMLAKKSELIVKASSLMSTSVKLVVASVTFATNCGSRLAKVEPSLLVARVVEQ